MCQKSIQGRGELGFEKKGWNGNGENGSALVAAASFDDYIFFSPYICTKEDGITPSNIISTRYRMCTSGENMTQNIKKLNNLWF